MAHVVVVVRMLIGVTHDKTNRSACRLAFENTTEQFYLVGFVARCGDTALPWASSVELLLDKIQVNGYACWHTINYAADGFSVALAKRGQSEDSSCSVH